MSAATVRRGELVRIAPPLDSPGWVRSIALPLNSIGYGRRDQPRQRAGLRWVAKARLQIAEKTTVVQVARFPRVLAGTFTARGRLPNRSNLDRIIGGTSLKERCG